MEQSCLPDNIRAVTLILLPFSVSLSFHYISIWNSFPCPLSFNELWWAVGVAATLHGGVPREWQICGRVTEA